MLTTESKNLKATVNGEVVTEIPEDLFIPPDALRVILEKFEGPLDLLLYLIKKQNVDIIDIPIFPITQQYVEYINLMQQLEFELASDYLVMASTLAEIKSKMLVPNEIDSIPRLNRDTFVVSGIISCFKKEDVKPIIDISQLEKAFQEVLYRAELFASHNIEAEALSVRERMSIILDSLNTEETITFIDCFSFKEGKMGAIVTFLAILEMVKENLIDIIQNEDFSMIYLQLKTS